MPATLGLWLPNKVPTKNNSSFMGGSDGLRMHKWLFVEEAMHFASLRGPVWYALLLIHSTTIWT
jgi:hypothetical protein